MAILGFQFNNIGQAGQIPQFIYINTNDTVATVQTPGYLNGIVYGGNPVDDTDFAVVVTKLTPVSEDHQVGLYNVVQTGRNWSLVEYGSEGSITGAANLGIPPGIGIFASESGSILQFKSLIAGSNVTLTPTSNSISIATGPPNVVWNNVLGGFQSATPGNGYFVSNSSTTTFTLPVTSAFGSIFEIAGGSGSGWILNQATGQSVNVGPISTTVGSGGSIASLDTFACIRVLCTLANTNFEVLSSFGNLSVT